MVEEEEVFTIKDINAFRKDYKDYNFYEEIDDSTILSLVEAGYFKHNKELILKDSFSITSQLFKKLINLPKSKYIKVLDLSELPINDKAFTYLSTGSQLEVLRIKSCEKIKGNGLVNFFASKNLMALKEVVFNDLNIDNEVLDTIIKNRKSMQRFSILKIIKCQNINNDSLRNLFTDKFTLNTLHLEDLQVEDEGFEQMAKCSSLSVLESITLTRIELATDEGFASFFQSIHLKRLKKIHIEDNEEVSEQTLSKLANLKNLESLELVTLNYVSFNHLKPLVQSQIFDNLKELVLKDVTSVDEDILQVIAKNPTFKSLEVLDISECSDVSSKGFEFLMRCANLTSKLKVLLLENDTFITEMSQDQKIINSLRLETLKEINFKGCNGISPSFVQTLTLIPSLANVKILNFINVLPFNDQALTYLGSSKYLRNVAEIYLDNCNEITSKGFDDLVKKPFSNSLEIISVKNCTKLDDDIFESISNSKRLKKLREIYLDKCDITSDGVDILIESEKMKNIEILGLTFAYYAFPAFYKSPNCINLREIKGIF